MPLPVAAAVAFATELWRILRPTEKVDKVAGAIEKATPALLEAAKQAVPTATNEQQAVDQIKANPQLQAQFKAAAMMKWDELSPLLEYEAKERKEARDFAQLVTSTGPEWKQMGAGVLIGVLSLFLVVGGGFLFWDMMYNPNLDPGQKGLILGALIAAFTTAVGFWFGSSASGRQSGQTVSDIAKSK